MESVLNIQFLDILIHQGDLNLDIFDKIIQS